MPAVGIAAAPAACGGVAQISDVKGDGHHANTDVTAAWFSEANGRLQAVVQVDQGIWEPAHDDSEAAAFAVVFTVGGQARYVRAQAPRNAPAYYDFGTWSASTGFTSQGATTGETTTGPGGTATIDLPPALGIVAGATLSSPFVLTYDGVSSDGIHWVDRAPGGVTPAGTEFGADYVVGSCAAPAVPAPGTAPAVTGVILQAPARVAGGGAARVRGRIVPARAGVPVALQIRTRTVRTVRLVTRADGTFTRSLPIGQNTRIRANAEGINSQTRTITARPLVRVTVRRLARGAAVVTGRVRPALSGRVLWLAAGDATPTAATTVRAGTFRLRFARPEKGRYQAVFIPSGGRAERATSNTGVIR